MADFNATANGQTIIGQEPGDTINLSGFSNLYVVSVQGLVDGNSVDEYSGTTIFLGSGSNNIVSPDTGDTIIGGTGSSGDRLFDNGSANLYQLGDEGFTAYLSSDDRLTAGNGDDTVLYNYPGARNGTISLGNGNNFVDAGERSGDFTVSAGTGSNNFQFGDMTGGNVTLSLAGGAGANFVELAGSTLSTVSVSIGASTGSNTINLSDADIAAATIDLGTGDQTINFINATIGDLTISLSAGDDKFQPFYANITSLTIDRAPGSGAETVDLGNTTIGTLIDTIGNSADVIELGEATITNFTLDVAVDEFKLPDLDGLSVIPTKVNYLATTENIAAPYNTAAPLPYFVADLLFSPTPHWNATLGQALTIDFSFMQSVPSYANAANANGFTPIGPNLPAGLSPSQILAEINSGTLTDLTWSESEALTAMAAWASVANVTYVSAIDSNSVPFRIGANNQDNSGAYSYDPFAGSYNPSSWGDSEAGDVYINSILITTNPTLSPAGNAQNVAYAAWAYVHEFGHVLGLGGESGDADLSDILPGGTFIDGGGEDTGALTVMSYDNPKSREHAPGLRHRRRAVSIRRQPQFRRESQPCLDFQQHLRRHQQPDRGRRQHDRRDLGGQCLDAGLHRSEAGSLELGGESEHRHARRGARPARHSRGRPALHRLRHPGRLCRRQRHKRRGDHRLQRQQ